MCSPFGSTAESFSTPTISVDGGTLARLEARYPDVPASTRVLETPSANSKEAERLLSELRPD